ncbi:MAG: class I SAM-dependent methyltransferase [Rhodothermales bacterium]|nr:class I SAM-dependent methyltransferase [Rhodothermales bacterium]MBO6780065.1 class I SAM-dependent methyltransferase [Rhodothermales bacterium]
MTRAQLAEMYQTVDPALWAYEPQQRSDWVLTRAFLPSSAAHLDVGCFDGAFQRWLGVSDLAFGIEINAGASDRARRSGITILGATAADLPEHARFDAITAFDVIEHVHDPLAFVRSLANHLNPGGRLILSSGNLDAPSWQVMGAAYWYSALAEHLCFISPKWSANAASASGLLLEEVIPFSHAGEASLTKRVAEVAKNLLYRASPHFSVWLRKRGMGEYDLDQYPGMALYPPIWLTARDQILVVMRQPA